MAKTKQEMIQEIRRELREINNALAPKEEGLSDSITVGRTDVGNARYKNRTELIQRKTQLRHELKTLESKRLEGDEKDAVLGIEKGRAERAKKDRDAFKQKAESELSEEELKELLAKKKAAKKS